jgi:hypothetical protein
MVFIDHANKTISFKNYFTRQTEVYPFVYFDGYLDTLKKSGRSDFRIFYLVKNKKLIHKMSGRVYSNMEEIEKGLTALRYFGFQTWNLSWSLKIFFRAITVE